MDFEKKLKRLEEIVSKMEGTDIVLEQSLKLFEEGVSLTKDCHLQLSQAEQSVKLLMGLDESGQPILKDFSVSEGER